MEAKLYSPIFCELRKYGRHEVEEISQKRTTWYFDDIHAAIIKERLPDEAGRGLMKYFTVPDDLDAKVRSVFVDVEKHADRLWAVATLEVTEPLTPDEVDMLREELSGQYSDGFGEGFEQRDIEVDGGELYVHLWIQGDDFFIDTQEQFAGRLGINIPPDILSQKPAESIIAPESDAVKFTEDRQRLNERADQNWKDYRYAPHDTTPDNLFSISVQVVGRRDACVFIRDYAGFTAEQLNCLLQFANPVELVADYLDPKSDISEMPGILANIMEEQENLKNHYALMPEAEPPDYDALEQKLRDTLADNLSVYKRDMLDAGAEELFKAAAEIASVQEVYEYFTQKHVYIESDVDFLLKFENPLELISEKWASGPVEITGKVDAIFNDQEQTLQNGGYNLVSDESEPSPAASVQSRSAEHGGQQSVLERIRQAAKEKQERPAAPRDAAERNKSGQEH